MSAADAGADGNKDDLRWVAVGKSSDWPETGGKLVQIGARRIGVYHYQGAWYALKEICPHKGVGLSQGPVRDGAVTCLGHGWTFDLRSGAVVRGTPGYAVATYGVREIAGVIEVGV